MHMLNDKMTIGEGKVTLTNIKEVCLFAYLFSGGSQFASRFVTLLLVSTTDVLVLFHHYSQTHLSYLITSSQTL